MYKIKDLKRLKKGELI